MFAAAKPLAKISIRGEIANFKRQASGHLYFSIKDANSQLKAIMFASNASRLDFRPSDGMRVIIECSISVYEKGGVYQAYVSSMQPDGIGALYLAYEKLGVEEITKELNEGVAKAVGGKLELVLRDTHTVRCEKERFDLWISIAREAIERNWQD